MVYIFSGNEDRILKETIYFLPEKERKE